MRYSGHVDSMEIEFSESKEDFNNKVLETEVQTKIKDYLIKEEYDHLSYLKAKRDIMLEILQAEEIPYSQLTEHIETVITYSF